MLLKLKQATPSIGDKHLCSFLEHVILPICDANRLSHTGIFLLCVLLHEALTSTLLSAKHCGRPWALTGLGCGACPGGTHSPGEGKRMDQQMTYNQAWSEF